MAEASSFLGAVRSKERSSHRLPECAPRVASLPSRRRASLLTAFCATAFFFVSRGALAQVAVPKVEAVYPHDSGAFTQGLEVFEGKLYESTGLNGRSTVRRVELTTGVVEKTHALEQSLFGEGMTRVDRTLIQLTYTTGAAIVYDIDTFAEIKRFTYMGQGWGLCYDGTDLLMTNGSDKLVFRDPATFEVRREVTVRLNGTAVDSLNELECVGSLVYMNQWKTDNIFRVDKATGNVLTTIDGSMLLTAEEKKNADVLNGIAYDASKRRFYLTGKNWPKLFEVSFDFAPGGDGDAGTAPPDAGTPDASTEAGGTPDAAPPRDSGRDAANDGPSIDGGAPRDSSGVRDGADARGPDVDASGSADDVVVPPMDAATRDDATSPPDGAGPGGDGSADGTGGNDGGCACRSARAPARSNGAAVLALSGAAMLAVLRRALRARRAVRRRLPMRIA
jgi:glutamine cyclotransferase